jgi:membrane protease YdiL (CAAX protease family)
MHQTQGQPTLKRHSLLLFFVLSYGISWLVCGLGARLVDDTFLTWLGSFGPALSAILLTAASQGANGLQTLLSRLFVWRVGASWYLAAMLLTPVTGSAVAAIYVLLNDLASALPGLDYWRDTGWQHVLLWVTATLLGTAISAGEELGWRGYALPRLQARYHPLVSSLVLGLLWGLWHFNPLLPRPETGFSLADILLFTAGTVSAFVIYTWLYNNTQQSVLVASLFHAVYDATVIWVPGVVPIPPGEMWIGLLALAALALLVILLAGPQLSYGSTQRRETLLALQTAT